jgi:hypothetical protein
MPFEMTSLLSQERRDAHRLDVSLLDRVQQRRRRTVDDLHGSSRLPAPVSTSTAPIGGQGRSDAMAVGRRAGRATPRDVRAIGLPGVPVEWTRGRLSFRVVSGVCAGPVTRKPAWFQRRCRFVSFRVVSRSRRARSRPATPPPVGTSGVGRARSNPCSVFSARRRCWVRLRAAHHRIDFSVVRGDAR